MTLNKLKSMIDYLVENYPETLCESIYAEHDELFLPLPKTYSHELVIKSDKLGFSLDDESLKCFT